MKKELLESFIKKYSLNSTIESVKWVAKNKALHVDTITEDKTVLVKVNFKPFEDFTGEEIGVHETSKLKGMLAPVPEEITMSLSKVKNKTTALLLSSDKTETQFPVADLDVIPSAPTLKNVPEFDCEIILDESLIDWFIKSKSGLPEVDVFTLLTKKDKTYLVLGYSAKLNTCRQTIQVAAKGTLPEPIHFSAKYFKEILTANSDCKASNLKVSSKGLSLAEFENENFKGSYYMVMIKMEE